MSYTWSESSDDDVPAPSTKHRQKKKRKVSDEEGFSSSDDEPVKDVEVAAYAHVVVPPPASVGSSRAAKSLKETVHRQEPFFFHSTSTCWPVFLLRAARAVSSEPDNLILARMTWQFMKPKNSKINSLSTEVGFKALRLTLHDKSKDYAIIVHMPAPVKPASDTVRYFCIVFWLITYIAAYSLGMRVPPLISSNMTRTPSHP